MGLLPGAYEGGGLRTETIGSIIASINKNDNNIHNIATAAVAQQRHTAKTVSPTETALPATTTATLPTYIVVGSICGNNRSNSDKTAAITARSAKIKARTTASAKVQQQQL